MRIFPIVAVLLFGLAQFSFAEKPALPSMVVPDGLGYNIHFTDPRPGEMEMLADSGGTIIRMDFSWNGIEREKGVYDFSAYERLTDSLEKHKIRPIYIFDYSNRHYDDNLSPHSPEGRVAFAKWAAAAAVHFQGRGILWEMYNEPNIQFWKPKPNTDDYIALALEVGKAIREAAPNELYIGPATSEIDLAFLEKCFKAGLLEYWDAVSVHPYRQTDPETVIAEYAKLRYMIDKYAPKGKHIPILSAEWGYSSGWGKYDDDLQGKMLPRQWMVNLACGVPVSIWYDWHDDGTDPKEPEHHFGTTNFEYHKDNTPVYDPKPAYLVAKTFNDTFKGFRYRKRLVVDDVISSSPFADSSETFIFLFDNEATQGASGNGVRLAVWTPGKEPKTITIPCSPGKFKVVSYLGKELPDLIADENGLTVTVSDGPLYLIPETTNKLLWDISGEGPEFPLAVYISNGPRIGEAQKIPFIPRQLSVDPLPLTTMRGRYKEVCQVYSASPLIVGTPMFEGDHLVVQVDNPSGEQFSGMLELEFTSRAEKSKNIQMFSLADGEEHVMVRFPVTHYDSNIPLQWKTRLWEVSHPMDSRLQSVVPVDDFSKYNNKTLNHFWKVVADGDAKVGSEQKLEWNDNGSAKITYRFDAGWKFLCFEPQDDQFGRLAEFGSQKPKSLSVRINADGSGNSVRLRFRDSKGQVFQVNGGVMSKTGPQNMTFDLTGKDASHWGGPDDGKINYPIQLESLVIDGTRAACGPFSVDVFSPVVVYDSDGKE